MTSKNFFQTFWTLSSTISSLEAISAKHEEIENNKKYLQNWRVPKQGASQIYNKETFSFKYDNIIKTIEENLPLRVESLDISLLSEILIDSSKVKLNYLRVRLVQIAIKPLSGEGLNNSISFMHKS